MGLKRTVLPTTPPVSVAEAKRQISLVGDELDAYVAQLIEVATETAEHWTGRALTTQTWRLTLDEFPCEIYLPRPPLLAVTTVEYVDANGALQTLSAANYLVASDKQPAVVTAAYNTIWPVTRSQREAVRVTYTAGYGANASDVPLGIRHAILLLVATWFANREAVVTGTISTELSLSVAALLDGYKTGAGAEWYGLAD